MKADRVRKIGPNRRRRFTIEERARIVKRGLHEALSIAELCRQENISSSNYYKWRKTIFQLEGTNDFNRYRNWTDKTISCLTDRIQRIEKKALADNEVCCWMLKILQGKVPISVVRNSVGDVEHLSALIDKACQGTISERSRSVSILSHLRGIDNRRIERFLSVRHSTLAQHLKLYKCGGVQRLLNRRKSITRKSEDQHIKNTVFQFYTHPHRCTTLIEPVGK